MLMPAWISKQNYPLQESIDNFHSDALNSSALVHLSCARTDVHVRTNVLIIVSVRIALSPLDIPTVYQH